MNALCIVLCFNFVLLFNRATKINVQNYKSHRWTDRLDSRWLPKIIDFTAHGESMPSLKECILLTGLQNLKIHFDRYVTCSGYQIRFTLCYYHTKIELNVCKTDGVKAIFVFLRFISCVDHLELGRLQTFIGFRIKQNRTVFIVTLWFIWRHGESSYVDASATSLKNRTKMQFIKQQ